MKYDFDSYGYYFFGSRLIDRTIRYRVDLKTEVVPEKLKIAVDTYANHHSWIKCRVVHFKDHVDIGPSENDILVVPFSKKYYKFSTKQTNFNMFIVEYVGNTIYFNISHMITGGVGFSRVILEILKEYISLIDSDYKFVFSEEDGEKEKAFPDENTFKDVKPLLMPNKPSGTFVPLKELSKSMIGTKKLLAVLYEFDTQNLMKIVKSVDSSPSAFFAALFYKALLEVYPKNTKPMCVQIMKNPLLTFPEYKNSRRFIGDKIFQVFPNEIRDYSLEQICTIIRGRIFAENDPSVNGYVINKALNYMNEVDKIKSYFKKVITFTTKNPINGVGGDAFTFIVSYNGKNEEPILDKYVDGLYIISGGTFVLEITNLNNKMCLCLHLARNYKKFTIPFEKVLKENRINFVFKGIQKRYLPKNR